MNSVSKIEWPIYKSHPRYPSWLRPDRFAHLHLHTVHSVQDGMIPVKKLVEIAAQNRQRIAAITDHGSMSGIWQLYDETKKKNILPAFGCELYVNPHRTLVSDRDTREMHLKNAGRNLRKNVQRILRRFYHLVALAINDTGYKNLLHIHNDAWMNGFYYKPTTDMRTILEHSEGLILSSACYAGEIPQLVYSGQYAAAKRLVEQFKEALEDRFFLELMINNFPLQRQLNHLLIRLARDTQTPTIITCDCHYVTPEDADLHSLVLNLGSRKDGSNASWEFDSTDLFIKSVMDLWSEWWTVHRDEVFTETVFRTSLENVDWITRRIEPIYLESTPRIPAYENEWEELKRRTVTGFQEKINQGMIPKERYGEYKDRMIFELKIIRKMKAISYMLLFSDVVKFCDDPRDPNLWSDGQIPESVEKLLPEEGVILRGTGRGSVGGSLVAWLLDITQGVDPIRFDLLFERFLDVNRIPKMKLGLK